MSFFKTTGKLTYYLLKGGLSVGSSMMPKGTVVHSPPFSSGNVDRPAGEVMQVVEGKFAGWARNRLNGESVTISALELLARAADTTESSR